MKEIDKLIRSLGTDPEVSSRLSVETPVVFQWRHRNRVPLWHVPALVKLAQERGQEHVTSEWLMSVNLKSATRRKGNR